jgi:hypothetical protein
MTEPDVTALAALQIVRGEPDEVEVAALVAGLAAVAAASLLDDEAPIEEWTNRARMVLEGHTTAVSFGGREGRHNTDAWRWSLRG